MSRVCYRNFQDGDLEAVAAVWFESWRSTDLDVAALATELGLHERIRLELEIGWQQFNDLNAVRRGLGLHEIESREIVFIGRHIHVSRSKDGYTIDDMILQIESALSAAAVVFANPRMTAMNNSQARADGYGNRVHDRAIFECTQRKPRAELFSVIPKGDDQKPKTKKAHP